ncbi:MAG: ATP-binding protein, partial [Trichodesmium sp. MAG_R03]|nr:ATP-binding protein [Trichodesmium sp. MAG_R03]
MSNTGFIGKEHNAHLNWFLNSWMSSNFSFSPVCFLEGFSGTGKTFTARELLNRVISTKQTAIMIEAPEIETDPTDPLLLELAVELNKAGRDELAKA